MRYHDENMFWKSKAELDAERQAKKNAKNRRSDFWTVLCQKDGSVEGVMCEKKVGRIIFCCSVGIEFPRMGMFEMERKLP